MHEINDVDKTNEQIVTELRELRQQIAGFEASEARHEQLEEALRESEERFRELAELMPETIYEVNLEGRLTFVNRNAYNYFGYTQLRCEQQIRDQYRR